MRIDLTADARAEFAETGASDSERCIACRSPLRLLTRRRGTLIFRCDACGLTVGNPDTPELEAAAVVATAPGHFALLRHEYPRHKQVTAELLERRLVDYQGYLGRPPRHWLEIGPGNGVLAELLPDKGCDWLGVEFDDEMAALMRAEGKPVVQGDFAAMEPDALMSAAVRENGGFDIVTFSQVLEHVRSAEQFVANANKALRPGGLLHLDVPNDGGLTAMLRRANPYASGYGEIVPPNHMIAYSATSLRRLLEAAGFEIFRISAYRYNHPVYGLVHARMNGSPRMRAIWALSGVTGGGGNLMALAGKRQ